MSSSTSTAGNTTTATRNPSETPFASDSVFNLPLGSGAQWTPNGQLASANFFINTEGNYNQPIYAGTASDPLVTVYSSGGSAGVAPATFQVHIPVGAEPSQPGDNVISIDDTTTGTWYSFGAFQWTSATTATSSGASAEPDNGSGVAYQSSNQDEGVGTLTEADLQAGTIDHTLRMELPTDMLYSYSNNVNQLAPNAWPRGSEDGFAVNGNGGTPYSGTIPFGVTIGIPASVAEPADIAANAGANMLWKALQDHGAMVRDSGGGGNTATFQADQNVSANDPLINGMMQYSSQIMAATEILANQGPNSVNGGGTPIVPLDPPLSDATSTSASATTSAPSTTSSDTATITSDSLSSGQTSTSSSSGMTFVASTDVPSTSASSSSSSSTDTISSTPSDAAASPGTVAASDFTASTGSGSSTSQGHHNNGSGSIHGAAWISHDFHAPTIAANQS